MTKYTLIAEHMDGMKVTTEFNEEYLPNVLSNFELFLRGVGFVFDGNLDFVTDEYPTTDTSALDEYNDSWPFASDTTDTELNLDYGAAQPVVHSSIAENTDNITITLTPEVSK
jgi:hypothetical protein